MNAVASILVFGLDQGVRTHDSKVTIQPGSVLPRSLPRGRKHGWSATYKVLLEHHWLRELQVLACSEFCPSLEYQHVGVSEWVCDPD